MSEQNKYIDFDPDQLREIEKGEQQGLDVSQFAQKDYLAIQMRQIRLGLKAGVDVSLYARLEYDWFQMEELRKGLERGLDITKYSKPSITYDRMRQIRKGLQRGVDLSQYHKLPPMVLRELRKAILNKINIVPFIQAGYEAEQLEQIRIALEKGLDIDSYVTPEFRGIAIREIAIGLERNLDVSIYARIEYSWQQMRELRLGMEGQLDVTRYSNVMYAWQQMRELRLGMEAGVDIAEYCSLMYTVTDMKRIRTELLTQAEEVVPSKSHDLTWYNDFLISVSGDDMDVYVEIHADAGTTYTRGDFEWILKQSGICKGLCYDAIDDILEHKRYNEKILIAKGVFPVSGKDGWYEYFFDRELRGKPAELEDGSVDYQNVQWFEMVDEGDRLAVYHPATAGTDGYTVKGKTLKSMRGKEQKILSGKGVVLLDDRCTYIAAYGGHVELDEEQSLMEISRVCVLPEVTLATGNVDFDGCVYIKGIVGRGTVVRATQDIVIDGAVEAATIACGGSLMLKKGMNGMGQGQIEASGTVDGKYFESVYVKSGGDLHANFCLNCSLNVEGMIVISGSKGVLAGGVSQAVRGVQAYHIGNRAQLPTVVRLGINDDFLNEEYALKQKIVSVQNELRLLGQAQIKFQRLYAPEVRNTMDMYIRIENAIYTKEMEQERLYKRKLQLEEDKKAMAGARAVVRGAIHEGCVVEIDKLRWISSEASNVTIRRVDNHIGVFRN